MNAFYRRHDDRKTVIAFQREIGRGGSAQDDGSASVLHDVAEKRPAGTYSAVVRRDIHQGAGVRIKPSRCDLNSIVRYDPGFKRDLAGLPAIQADPRSIGRHVSGGLVDIDRELGCTVYCQRIPADMRDLCSACVVEVDCDEEQSLFRSGFKDELFLPLNFHHAVGIAKNIRSNEKLRAQLLGCRGGRLCAGRWRGVQWFQCVVRHRVRENKFKLWKWVWTE